jgi:hypothetical protein
VSRHATITWIVGARARLEVFGQRLVGERPVGSRYPIGKLIS